jgi:hypothetical protein
MDGFSSNLRWTYYKSQYVARAMYCSYSCTALVCKGACASAHVVNLQLSWTDSLQSWWAHATHDHTLHGILDMFKHRVQACVCELTCASACVTKRSLIWERILPKFGGDIQHIPIGYTSYLICVWMHVLTARTSIHSQIFQARDGQWLVIWKDEIVMYYFSLLIIKHNYVYMFLIHRWCGWRLWYVVILIPMFAPGDHMCTWRRQYSGRVRGVSDCWTRVWERLLPR